MAGVSAKNLKSKFIVLDGGDGCGKSTQLKRVAQQLTDIGADVLAVRDPGTTSAGEAIRQIILSGDHGKLNAECELLLFMAARAQMMTECILPALDAGRTVLCDRFISASCAYQGASGLDPKSIIRIGEFAAKNRWPDLTLVLDVPCEIGAQRRAIGRPGVAPDAMEKRSDAFHQNVRRIFLELPKIYPAPIRIIDATTSIDAVTTRLMEAIDHVDA